MNSIALALLLGLSMDRPVEIIAHRGESYDAPENTLAAFRLAWERHVSTIELDVHLSRDGALIVNHDGDTKRTTGAELQIKESTRDELRPLDAGAWKGSRWAGERLPTLSESLSTIPQGGRCFIEIKVGPEAVAPVARAVRESGKAADQLAIISFKAETVAEAKRAMPELKAYYLSNFKQDRKTGEWTPRVEDLISLAREIKADGLDLAAKGPVDAEFARKVKQAGLGLYVWTVDDPAEARRFVEAGVDGITTNRAAWLKERLSGSAGDGKASDD